MSNIAVNTDKRDEQIDLLEYRLLENLEVLDAPITDIFVDGVYVREMRGPANSFIVSKKHKTEHIFILTQGTLTVFDGDNEGVVLQAPYRGVTKPGTRRWAYIWPFQDVLWLTVHANPDNEGVAEIEDRIIEKHYNALLTDEMKQKMLDVKHYVHTLALDMKMKTTPENY